MHSPFISTFEEFNSKKFAKFDEKSLHTFNILQRVKFLCINYESKE